jgi:hypothetical protein
MAFCSAAASILAFITAPPVSVLTGAEIADLLDNTRGSGLTNCAPYGLSVGLVGFIVIVVNIMSIYIFIY